MGFAISLRSDHSSAQRIQALWVQVERFEDLPSMAALSYSPHMTLAIYDGEALHEPLMCDVLQKIASSLNALSVAFDAVKHFDGPPFVLWAAPQPKTAVMAAHAAIHRHLDPLHCRPYYRPGAWTPHCTLGTRIRNQDREAALLFASKFEGCFSVTFDAVDCVSFPALAPVEMRTLPLAGFCPSQPQRLAHLLHDP